MYKDINLGFTYDYEFIIMNFLALLGNSCVNFEDDSRKSSAGIFPQNIKWTPEKS